MQHSTLVLCFLWYLLFLVYFTLNPKQQRHLLRCNEGNIMALTVIERVEVLICVEACLWKLVSEDLEALLMSSPIS